MRAVQPRPSGDLGRDDRRQWEIPRSELDELGVRSHQLAQRATEEGRFEREIVPMQVNGDTYVTDQGIRPETTHRDACAG